MAKVKRPHRSDISIFDEKDAYFFYENILLVCESDKKSYGDEKILTDAAKKVNASIPFDFVCKNYEVEMQTPKDNVFYFSAEAMKQGSSRNSHIVKKWYKHLRNAFAHNYIRLENGAYVMEDYYDEETQTNSNHKKIKTQKVLYARILSLEDFKSLINEVKPNIK
jgi:activator of 2-hydroxyglutaryl-CoA dehydratase